jgi:hypothetical protein
MAEEVYAYIHYGEYDFSKDYPTLVIQAVLQSAGYSVDPDTGELSRCCICHARSERECTCGYDASIPERE